jgi:hypothetical protein
VNAKASKYADQDSSPEDGDDEEGGGVVMRRRSRVGRAQEKVLMATAAGLRR